MIGRIRDGNSAAAVGQQHLQLAATITFHGIQDVSHLAGDGFQRGACQVSGNGAQGDSANQASGAHATITRFAIRAGSSRRKHVACHVHSKVCAVRAWVPPPERPRHLG